MAGNSSEMTVAQSKPQDSVSRAREPDTARPAEAAATAVTAAAAIGPMDSSWTPRPASVLK